MAVVELTPAQSKHQVERLRKAYKAHRLPQDVIDLLNADPNWKWEAKPRRTHADFIREMKVVSPNIKIIGTYTRVRDKVEVQCRKCKSKSFMKAADLLAGKWYCSCLEPEGSAKKANMHQEAYKQRKIVCVEADKEYESIYKAQLDVPSTSWSEIYECINNIRETSGGYHWQYAIKIPEKQREISVQIKEQTNQIIKVVETKYDSALYNELTKAFTKAWNDDNKESWVTIYELITKICHQYAEQFIKDVKTPYQAKYILEQLDKNTELDLEKTLSKIGDEKNVELTNQERNEFNAVIYWECFGDNLEQMYQQALLNTMWEMDIRAHLISDGFSPRIVSEIKRKILKGEYKDISELLYNAIKGIDKVHINGWRYYEFYESVKKQAEVLINENKED